VVCDVRVSWDLLEVMVAAAALLVALVRSEKNLQLARLLSNSADRMSHVCAVQISTSALRNDGVQCKCCICTSPAAAWK
jgi:septum formation inhibitor-activating ATPase MinD